MSSQNIIYNTQNELFGPINAGDIGFNDAKMFMSLFQSNNWRDDKYRGRPTIIAGRRGSGKTHYLRQIIFDQQYDYYVEIQAPRALRYVAKIVQVISKDILFIEMVEDVWEMILWVAVFSEVRKQALLNPDSLALVESYLSNIGVRENADVDEALLAAANNLSERMSSKHEEEIFEPIKNFGNITFKDVRNVVESDLKLSQRKLVIIIDSVQGIQFDISSMERALQGLLKFIGAMNKPRDVVDIRFCLPSELYPKFNDLSLNPTKDFQRVFTLQWNEGELVRIGAQRLYSYLASYHPKICEKFTSLDLKTNLDAFALFDAVLPKHIMNRFGYKEETIFYIMRHTQFVPRHFLILLNSIFNNLTSMQRANPFPINEEHIVGSVQQTERILFHEIILPFRSIYPAAEQICKRCLSMLGYIFSRENLKRVFKDQGQALFGDEHFDEFEKMLLEIGVIGRVVPSLETDIYIKADFEYTAAQQLSFKQDAAAFCVHPLFSDIFQFNGKQDRPVFPYRRIDVEEKPVINTDEQITNNIQRIFSRPSMDKIKVHQDNSALSGILEESKQHVFVSYNSEDKEIVDRLQKDLQSFGIHIWRDRDNLYPGMRWKTAIRKAIRDGAFFIFCFSKATQSKAKSYVYEELNEAIDELRMRPKGRAWFLPVKLNKCDIPDWDIGGGETLNDIHYVELFTDWPKGINDLVTVINKNPDDE